MNMISWFLYFVDVFGTISRVSSVLLMISIILGGLCLVGYLICRGSYKSEVIDDMQHEEFKDKPSYNTRQWKAWLHTWCAGIRIFAPIFIITLILSAFIPTPRTMYLIIGSEIGEEVVMSDTGKRIQKLIDQKLEEYLNEGKTPEEDKS